MKKILSTLIIVITLTFVSTCAFGDTVYATIGGKLSVTSTDLNYFIAQASGPNQITNAQKSALINQLIEMKLFNYLGMQNGYQNQPTFQDQMAKQEKALLTQAAYQQYIVNPSTPTTAEIQAQYNTNKSKYVTPTKADVSQIVVKTQTQANVIMAQLKGKTGNSLNTTFSQLAKAQSQDTVSAKQGGHIGVYSQDTTIGQYKTIIFGMKKPGVAQPFSMSGMYVILKVNQVYPGHAMSLAEATPIISESLQQQAMSEVAQNWFNVSLKQYGIVNQANLVKYIGGSASSPVSGSGLVSRSSSISGSGVAISGTATLATINGSNITVADINRAINDTIAQSGQSNVTITPKLRQQIYNQVVFPKLLLAVAQKNNLQDTLTYQQMYTFAQMDLLANYTVEQLVVNKVSVTQAQAQAFYNQNATQIGQPFAKVQTQIMNQLKQQAVQNGIQQIISQNIKLVVTFNTDLTKSSGIPEPQNNTTSKPTTR